MIEKMNFSNVKEEKHILSLNTFREFLKSEELPSIIHIHDSKILSNVDVNSWQIKAKPTDLLYFTLTTNNNEVIGITRFIASEKYADDWRSNLSEVSSDVSIRTKLGLKAPKGVLGKIFIGKQATGLPYLGTIIEKTLVLQLEEDELENYEIALLYLFSKNQFKITQKENITTIYVQEGTNQWDEKTLRNAINNLIGREDENIRYIIGNKKLSELEKESLLVHQNNNFNAPVSTEMTQVEKQLLNVFKELLDDDAINILDNFFEIGGNSLLAVQLTSRIHKEFGVKLTLKELFKNSVIKELAKLISLKERVDYLSIDTLQEEEYYELSSAQLRLWILSQNEETSVAYNEFNAMKITGEIDVELLNKAVKRLTNRHEILRTSFITVKGDPKQLIHPINKVQVQVKLDDFSQKEAIEIEKTLLKESKYRFNLAEDVLIRVNLLKTDNNEYIIMINMHHIISDGWSQVVLFNELIMTYYELANDLDIAFQELPIQYKDYAHWHNDILLTDKVNQFKDYWNTKFAERSPKVDLTAFQKRRPQQSFHGKVNRYELDSKYYYIFKEISQRTQTTMFSVVLTYFKTLLYKYSGQKDITVGTSVAGRNHPDLEGQIGFYVNTIPIKNTINPEYNFVQQLQELSNNLLNDFDHDIYPFELLVADLGLMNEEVGMNPLFDVFVEYFNYNDRFISEEKIIGEKKLKIAPLTQDNETTIFGINVMFIESNEKISIEVRYDTEQFEDKKINSLIEHFTLLIDKITATPDEKIKTFEILSSAEIEKLEEFAKTEKPLPVDGTVLELIEKHVQQTPNDIAITYENVKMTYKELWTFSNKIANFLTQHHQGEKQYRVGVFMDRSCYTLAALLGAWKAGAVYIPLDPDFPTERLKYILDNSEASLLFTDKQNIKVANKLQWSCNSLQTIAVMDSYNIHELAETENKTMDVELWEYIGSKAHDDITGGGWFNSYDGEAFTRQEMNEYRDNTIHKLLPYVDKDKKVLEIGCASGLTMFSLVNKVESYVGIDLSQVILDKNQAVCEKEGITNLKMYKLFAHEIDQLKEKDFDIIIINSVIQNFNGHNYLREVLDKSIAKLNTEGILFLGDLINQDKKQDLIEDLKEFKKANPKANTKLEWDEELFVSKSFIDNYIESKDIKTKVTYSDKLGRIQNELKKFRFDAVLEIDKEKPKTKKIKGTIKYQFDLSHIESQQGNNYPNLALPQDVSYIIYTSGSTGKPKGAIVQHIGMLNHLEAKKNDLELNKQSKIVQNASQCFDISIWQYVNALMVGGQTYVYSNEVVLNPDLLLTKLKEDQITIFEVVPSYMQVLLDCEERRTDSPMSSLTYYLVNGETLKPRLARKWFDHYTQIPLINCYGPTEASDDVTHYFLYEKPSPDLRIPIGNKPIQNFRFHFLDNDYNRVPIGAKGEICLSGIGVGLGYVNDEEKTKKAFMQDPFFPNRRMYKTGDIGRVLEDGTIDFFGRKDTQVKIRGYRIELEEIEIAITKSKGVVNAVVLVGKDSNELSYLCAFVMTSDDNLNGDYIKEQIQLELPEYMVPGVIKFLKEFPLNHNGKTDKNVLKQMMNNQESQSVENFVAPIGELEKAISEVWEKVIGVKPIGRNDNFFTLGGHSVSAIQAISKIKNEYDINLPLKELFEHPTVEKLAEAIEKYKKEDNNSLITSIVKKTNKAKYKISPVQYAEWYLQKLNANSTFYNIGFILELTGNLNQEAFLETISHLSDRHDIFKFTIIEEDGVPYQVLKEKSFVDINDIIVDYSHLGKDEINLQEIVLPYFNTIFDFTQGMVNVKLIKINEKRHVFVFETHHIVWDQISTFNFYREFIQTYNTLNKREEIFLPELKVNYSDYTEWINELIDSGKLEKQRKYWLNKYQKLPETLELPTDYPRPLIHSFNGKFIFETLGLEFKNEISEFCHENGVTYQIFLISVLNLLLYRLTNQEDFVVGTPIWNRDQEHLDKVLGLFASGIPIRCTLGKDWTFNDLLSHTKTNSLEAYENHLYPFNKIIEELNPITDFSRQKVISVFFGVQNDETELKDVNLNGLDVKDVSNELDTAVKNTSVFDFTLQVDHNKDNMWFTLRYNTDLFKEETANNFLTRYKELVKQIIENSSKNLLDYNFLIKKEKSLIEEVSVSPTKFTIPDVGLHTIINETATKYSNKVAVKEEDKEITYGELKEYSYQIANFLLKNKVQKQDRVGVLLPRSIDFIASVLGILNSGAIFVPLSKDYPEQRVQEIINQAEIQKIITVSGFFNQEFLKAPFADSLVLLDEIDFSTISKEETSISVSNEDLIYTIFTSGSTGKPKGIDIKHVGAINIIQSTINDFNFTPDEKVLFHTATVFDASIMDYLWPLVAGAGIVVMPNTMEKSILNYEELINKNKITHIQSVPLLLESFVNAIERKEINQLQSLKRVVVGGAILNTKLSNRFLNEFKIDLYNCYGPTETTVDSTRYKCEISNLESQIFAPIGIPVANTKLYVLDKNLQQVPVGVPGELYIASIGSAKGYLNDVEKTNKTFIKNPFNDGISQVLYKTGDKVALLHKGNYVVYGRLDNQIKLNGNRIEIEEIESLLLNCDGLYNGAVILDKKGSYEQLIAFVEPEKQVNQFITENSEKVRVLSLNDDITIKGEFEQFVERYAKANPVVKKLYQDLIYQFPEYQLCLFVNGELVAVTLACPISFLKKLEENQQVIFKEILNSEQDLNATLIVECVKKDTMLLELCKDEIGSLYKQLVTTENKKLFLESNTKISEITAGNTNFKKTISKEEIKQYLSEYLPQYMIPNNIVIKDRIALNNSGKVDKNILKKLNVSKQFKKELELTETQEKVNVIFQEILKKDTISAHDSFFELGGHSINMIQLIARVEKEFSIKMPIPEVFNNQTPYHIGNYVDAHENRIVNTSAYLQQLSSGGEKNIFCFPSISATVADFIELAKELKGYNLYAFDFSLLDAYSDVYQDKKEIIQKCKDMIFDVNANQTFDVLGYSAGSHIAYELLSEFKEELQVDKFIILDMEAPRKDEVTSKLVNYKDAEVDEFMSLNILEDFSNQEKEQISNRVWKYAELASYVAGREKINVPFYVFASEEADKSKQQGWEKLTQKSISFSEFKGNHYEILKNKFVKKNSQILKLKINNK
ncbi:conserved hypothetical protein [Tenacibaculum sp. 190524A02b]|uniref:Carrier domain-containing protein n=2 Tax=Tenacibaculum vairaonense TaxID=3137860 RepID=A0ABP1FHG1_9FLAO